VQDNNADIKTDTKSVFVLITGRPNVGKSTLLNTLLGEKAAIVSNKPQTTRTRINGVLTEGGDQYVFIDTPGLHKPKNLLGEYMMRAAGSAYEDADLVLFVTDPASPLNQAERAALKSYSGVSKILVINKTDKADKTALLEYIARVTGEFSFDAVVPISALTGDGVDRLKKEIKNFLVPSPHFFPPDIYTDQPEKQIAAEIIREKVLRLTNEEIPHGVAVTIEEFRERKGVVAIRAEIYAEKKSHKKILIGHGGGMLKKIGTYAREDIEKLLGQTIYLDLWVKIKEDWRDKAGSLSSFGYRDNK